MSYQKATSISGLDKEGGAKAFCFPGHWNLQSAIKAGRRYGIIGRMTVEHCIFDHSGRGRSGHDGKWNIFDDNAIVLVEEFREGGKVKKPSKEVVK